MAKKRVLVVGGAGYIGSHVNKMLHDQGYETVVLDNYSASTPQKTLFGEQVAGDTAIPEHLDALFTAHKFDAVMHFGAYIDVRESVEKPEKYYENNVGGTLNLLSAMTRHGCNKLIFSSTAAVYGVPQTEKIDESHQKAPINPYGHSKLMVEQMLQDFEQAHGIKSCVFRYFNAAGGDPDGVVKNHQTKSTNLIPIVLKSLLSKSTVTVNGNDFGTPDGTCVRDYIHICDIGSAHLLGMERLLDGGDSLTCNLGNGNGFSIREVLTATEKVTGHQVATIDGPARAGDPAILIADAKQAAAELNWQPKWPDLDKMLDHAWKGLPR